MSGIIEVVIIWSVLGALGGGGATRKIYKKYKAKQAIKNKVQIEKRRMIKYVKKTSVVELTSKKAKDICVICQEDFTKDNIRAKLHCGHNFHPCCIIEWMNYKKTCPLCNTKLQKKKKN